MHAVRLAVEAVWCDPIPAASHIAPETYNLAVLPGPEEKYFIFHNPQNP